MRAVVAVGKGPSVRTDTDGLMAWSGEPPDPKRLSS
jgi:hypothetical protein